MNHSKLIDELLQELSYRVGIVDIYNKEQQSLMSEILTEWGEFEAKYIIMSFLNEDEDKRFKNPALNRTVDYTTKSGEDKEGIVGNLLRLPEDEPGRIAAEKRVPKEGTPEREELNQELGEEGGGGDQTKDGEQEEESQEGDGGQEQPQEEPQGQSLNPNTEEGKEYTDNLPEEDPAFTGEKKIEENNTFEKKDNT